MPAPTRARRARVVHKAKHIAPNGAVSALCFATPRAIDMTRASWTTDTKAVTCPKCLAKGDTPAPPADAEARG